jgi:hypothetical protein
MAIFYFGNDSASQKILSQAPADAHVLSMSRFMIEKNRDLEISYSGQQISPRDCLVVGYDPEPVMVILSGL